MASHRAERRRQCGSKKHYPDEAAARAAAAAFRHDFGGRVSAYRCPHGNHWHIGHTPAKVVKAMRA